jgi:hypothetical protein
MKNALEPFDAVRDAKKRLLTPRRKLVVRRAQRLDIETETRRGRPELVRQCAEYMDSIAVKATAFADIREAERERCADDEERRRRRSTSSAGRCRSAAVRGSQQSSGDAGRAQRAAGPRAARPIVPPVVNASQSGARNTRIVARPSWPWSAMINVDDVRTR